MVKKLFCGKGYNMCRSSQKGGRRCPHGSDGTRGCEYFDERLKKVLHIPEAPQHFPTIHKENVEELSQTHTQEELNKPVTPEQYENFHRVVNRMINDSELSDHDKMIARKQWNRTQKEVENGGVSQVALSTWQKMLVASCLLAAEKIGTKKAKGQWKGYQRYLATSFSVKEFATVLPFAYDTKEEFEEAAKEAGEEPNDQGWFDHIMDDDDDNDGDDGDDHDDEQTSDEEFWVETDEPVIVPTRKENELTDYEERELAARSNNGQQ